MGAGHDGAARELARRLESDGHHARVVDFLDAPPARIGRAFKAGYVTQLRFAPWAYEMTYRLWYRFRFLIGPVTALVNLLGGRRLLRWAKEWRADVVVSTYPLASLALGRRRERGELGVPVVTYVTDFAVHPLLVHRGVDLHLCVHPQSAAKAAARVPGPVRATGPLVGPAFFARRPGRPAARRRVGLAPGERGVLIVAGSWGVGDVVEAFDLLAASPAYSPVVVCGENTALAAQLRELGTGYVFEWTDEMALLMRACDAVVQNAGGLTCMEAFASGLPVVSFRPIPGHGIENAEDMASAGVAPYVREPTDLIPTLDLVTGSGRDAARAASRAMFARNAAADVAEVAAMPRTIVPIRSRRPRVAIAAAAAAVAFYGSFTTGVGVAAAHGVGVSRAPRQTNNVYVAVRLSNANANDERVETAMARLHASAIVDGRLARSAPDVVAGLQAHGIKVDNGGVGRRVRIRAARAEEDVALAGRDIGRASGRRPTVFVPTRAVNGYDLVAARFAHEHVVVGHRFVDGPLTVRAGRIYVVDARAMDANALLRTLDRLNDAAIAALVVPVPLDSL